LANEQRRHAAAILAVTLILSALPTISRGGEWRHRQLEARGARLPYALWVPRGEEPERGWPLVVFLHGSGESGRDGKKPTQVGLGPQLAAHPERWPCLVLMPQKPTETEEWTEYEDFVLASVAAVRSQHGVDPDRIALTGMSQGGHGTYYIGARHPELFGRLAPVCGYGRARTLASRLADRPVWAFHGLLDDVVEPRETALIIKWIHDLRRARGLDPDLARLTIYPEANHNSWDRAYGEPALPDWLTAVNGPAAAEP
jgi:predicted peptidase